MQKKFCYSILLSSLKYLRNERKINPINLGFDLILQTSFAQQQYLNETFYALALILSSVYGGSIKFMEILFIL